MARPNEDQVSTARCFRCLCYPTVLLTGIAGSHAHDDLTNVDTSDSAVGLAPGTTHTRLQSIGTGTRQHLVDTDDVVGVSADTQMETILSSELDQVFVGANTGGFESLGAQLLVLVGDEMDAQRELIDGRTLPAKIEDSDLRVGNTTVEPGLGIRLDSLVVSMVQYFPCASEFRAKASI
jgi:hypothetical protein